MPEISDFEVVQCLPVHLQTQDIPVFVMTAKDPLIEDKQELNSLVAAVMCTEDFAKDIFLEDIGLVRHRTTAQERRPRMAGERILLVEDNPQNRRLTQFLLHSHGYRVYEATTGEEALELARIHRPEIILMDLQLPGVDGYAVTRRLKRDAATAGIPIVALTAYAMQGDREKALAAGCDGYITKPIDTKGFPAAVQRYLALARETRGEAGDAASGENPGCA